MDCITNVRQLTPSPKWNEATEFAHIKMVEGTASVGPSSASPGTGVAQGHTCLVTYLIKVDHDIALRASAALDILQGQGEVDTPGV